METFRSIVVGILFVTLVLGVLFSERHSGRERGIEIMQKEAISHGAAEYVCDPATGETTFRWKEGK